MVDVGAHPRVVMLNQSGMLANNKRQREATMTAGATSGNRFRCWPEILANAARAAGGLRALGVAEDDSVALMLRNDFATFEVNMAAGHLGAYAVPINWHFTSEEAGYILADSRAKVLLMICWRKSPPAFLSI
jgi:acyl-CoA synthetase (AMP-forming)/AMP-acid ligase II